MISRLRFWAREARSSFWFIPLVLVTTAGGLALALVTLEPWFELRLLTSLPMLFGAGAAGSRSLLAAIATSMITIAGVVFSITLVALSLTSSQYTSRVLRNFIRDRTTQVVLGVFVGNFVYCIVVLRTIRAGDEGVFVPSIAVLGSLALAVLGVGVLIYFIHHVSTSIQASSIIAAATQETIAAIDELFPASACPAAERDDAGDAADPVLRSLVMSQKSGYVEGFDVEGLIAYANAHAAVVRVERCVGEFVLEGSLLVSISGAKDRGRTVHDELNALFHISAHRTVEQDPGFGIRQIVDIALKALSPGVNDTTTAVMCVDYLSAILVRLASRRLTIPPDSDGGTCRLITRYPTFAELLAVAFDQIRHASRENTPVLLRQLVALEAIAHVDSTPTRREALREQLDLTVAAVAHAPRTPREESAVHSIVATLQNRLGAMS